MGRNIAASEAVNEVLKGLIVAGMAGSIIFAPNAIQLGEVALKYLDKRSRKLESKRLIDYMRRKRLVTFSELPDGQLMVHVTEQGKKRMQKVDFDKMKISVPPKWDQKWRLVMFDIPEGKRKARSALSMKLKLLGFYQLQKSAWVYPYPCDREIELTKEVFGIPYGYVISADVAKIDQESILRKHFNL